MLSGTSSNLHNVDGNTTANTQDAPMTIAHKNIIRACSKQLIDDGEPDSLIQILFSFFVLTDHDTEKLKETSNVHKKMEILIKMILRKPDASFMKLCDALRQSHQDHLSGQLLEKERLYRPEDYPPENQENHAFLDAAPIVETRKVIQICNVYNVYNNVPVGKMPATDNAELLASLPPISANIHGRKRLRHASAGEMPPVTGEPEGSVPLDLNIHGVEGVLPVQGSLLSPEAGTLPPCPATEPQTSGAIPLPVMEFTATPPPAPACPLHTGTTGPPDRTDTCDSLRMKPLHESASEMFPVPRPKRCKTFRRYYSEGDASHRFCMHQTTQTTPRVTPFSSPQPSQESQTSQTTAENHVNLFLSRLESEGTKYLDIGRKGAGDAKTQSELPIPGPSPGQACAEPRIPGPFTRERQTGPTMPRPSPGQVQTESQIPGRSPGERQAGPPILGPSPAGQTQAGPCIGQTTSSIDTLGLLPQALPSSFAGKTRGLTMKGTIFKVDKADSYFICKKKECSAKKKKLFDLYCSQCKTQYKQAKQVGRGMYAYLVIRLTDHTTALQYRAFTDVIEKLWCYATQSATFTHRGDLRKKLEKELPLTVEFKTRPGDVGDPEVITEIIQVTKS